MPQSPANKFDSLLAVVDSVDTFRFPTTAQQAEAVAKMFKLVSHDSSTVLGYILPAVAVKLASILEGEADGKADEPNKAYDSVIYPISIDLSTRIVQIHPKLSTYESRNAAFAKLSEKLRTQEFYDVASGWRGEVYTVFGPDKLPYFQVERGVAPLLGIVMYGVHINGWVRSLNDPADMAKARMWIPTRSMSKATFPGMLDNTVAGGIGDGMGILETAIKECYEEAGFDTEFVRLNLKSAGAVSYLFQEEPFASLAGVDDPQLSVKHRVQPEVEYVYDLEVPNDVVPQPIDGEAQDFQLKDFHDILQDILRGRFKPNCALVIIDFFIRHGVIKPGEDADYLDIITRIHRETPFPTR